ncbi:hypothetical protein FQA39_LY10312 [Lamprigera yunnana]|nr:hypothetical protein FQA39_LY10312 [Lamprigera yunnana]
MSFFIKNKPNKKPKLQEDDEEVTSTEEEDEDVGSILNDDTYDYPQEGVNETAQEKKLRLAKIYLEEIVKEESARLEQKEEYLNGEVISERLKLDYLKQVGKLKVLVADEYIGADVDNIKVLNTKEHKKTITCLCLSSNNEYMYTGSKDGSIVKWSLLEYKKVGCIPFQKNNQEKFKGHTKQILCMTLSSDDKYMIVGDATAIIQVWNPFNLEHIGSLKGHRDLVTGLICRRDTHTLYSCSNDRSIKVWALDEMSYVETLYGHQDKITSIDVLSKERPITSGGRDASIRIWKIVEESQLIYNCHSGCIDVVRLVNEGHFISGGDDGNICVWTVSKKKPLYTVTEAHGCDSTNSQPNWITSLTSLINTDLIASGSNDGHIRLWKLENGFRKITLLFSIEVKGFVNNLTFTSDGKYLLAGIGNEHRLGRWSVIKNAKNGIVIVPLNKK